MTKQQNQTSNTSAHAQLFEEYVQALRRAVEQARTEHDDVVNKKALEGLSREAAEAEAEKELGLLCTHPRIIAVFRQYFLACDKLNRDEMVSSFVYPHVFTIELLMGKHDDLCYILADLPYLPVGTNEQDHWV